MLCMYLLVYNLINLIMAGEGGYVDTHFHVWELERFEYAWPTPDMKIYRNYFPSGIETESEDTPVKYGVFVQCLHSVQEAEWVMDMATRHPFIVGVVAGLDPTDPKLEEKILSLKKNDLMKGVRFLLDTVADDWIIRDDVSKGLGILAKHNLTFDLQVGPQHLKYVLQVVKKHPDLQFVIDHIACPPFSSGRLDGWKEDLEEVAKFPNVHCKISGLISGMDPATWKGLDYKLFVDHVLAVFGPDRCMYGSDWPVFQMVGASYAENLTVVQKCVSNLNEQDRRKLFRDNAIKFYSLKL